MKIEQLQGNKGVQLHKTTELLKTYQNFLLFIIQISAQNDNYRISPQIVNITGFPHNRGTL